MYTITVSRATGLRAAPFRRSPIVERLLLLPFCCAWSLSKQKPNRLETRTDSCLRFFSLYMTEDRPVSDVATNDMDAASARAT